MQVIDIFTMKNAHYANLLLKILADGKYTAENASKW